MPICGMHELLLALGMQYYLFIYLHFRLSVLLFGKTTVNILIGIKLPSLPVSILHSCIFVVWVVFISNFAIITNQMLCKLKIFDLIILKSLADTSVSSDS